MATNTGGLPMSVEMSLIGAVPDMLGICEKLAAKNKPTITGNRHIALSLTNYGYRTRVGDVPRFLHPDSVAEVLSQAVLVSPMFTARWRWNLNRSLTVLRQRAGKRNPPPIQRMEADDLMAAVFPGLAACQEHQTGPIEIPDHVLVRQTMHDCLHEAMDIDGLTELLKGFVSGAIETEFSRKSSTKSPP